MSESSQTMLGTFNTPSIGQATRGVRNGAQELRAHQDRLYFVMWTPTVVWSKTGLDDKINKHVPNSVCCFFVRDCDHSQSELWSRFGPNCIVEMLV